MKKGLHPESYRPVVFKDNAFLFLRKKVLEKKSYSRFFLRLLQG